MSRPRGARMRPGALDRILADRGLTAGQVADTIGVHRWSLTRMSRGQRGASGRVVSALVEALDVRPSDLFVMPQATPQESPRTHRRKARPGDDPGSRHADPQK